MFQKQTRLRKQVFVYNIYVDVVGLDYYANDLSDLDLNSSLTSLLAFNKPICIAEIGAASNENIDVNEADNMIYLGLNN